MSESPANRCHVELSFDDKLKIIRKFKSIPKQTLKTLSQSLRIGKSTVGDNVKKRDSYKEQYE